MLKIFKNRLFIILITSIVCISGAVAATTLYYSEQVSYNPTDSSWNVNDVKNALDQLYNKINSADFNVTKIGDYIVGLNSSSTTIDLSEYDDYQSFEYGKNIIVEPSIIQDGNGNTQRKLSYSYNKENGQFVVTIVGSNNSFLYFYVYIIK